MTSHGSLPSSQHRISSQPAEVKEVFKSKAAIKELEKSIREGNQVADLAHEALRDVEPDFLEGTNVLYMKTKKII